MGDGNPGVDPHSPDLAADDAVDGSVAGGFGVSDPGAVGQPVAWSGVGRAGLGGGSRSFAAVVLAEYVTGRTFGLDQVWFGDAVRTLQPTLPGRPSPPTAASVLLLSVTVALKRTNRPGFRAAWAGCLVAAMVIPFVTIVAYLFGAVARLEIAPSTGMAVTTAVGLLLLGVACMLLRPAWLLARSDRLSLIRLGMILAGFPLLVGLSRRAYLALGLRDDLALTFATATATMVLGTAAYRLSRREHALLEASESDRTALRDNADSLLASERKYRLLAENVADVVYLVQDGKIAWVSASVEQVSGAPPEYWVGRELREAIPPEDWAESAERNATVLTGGVVAACPRDHSRWRHPLGRRARQALLRHRWPPEWLRRFPACD